MTEAGPGAFSRGAGVLGGKGGWATGMAGSWGWRVSKRAEDFGWQDQVDRMEGHEDWKGR